MLRILKRPVEHMLRGNPRLYALFSKAYHRWNRSFDALSPGAPVAIRRALERSLDGLVGDDGDYYEFGLFRGGAFWFAQQACRELGMQKTHFYGFDSFSGLPAVEGVDKSGNRFFEGQFSCSKGEVIHNLTKHGVDWSRTTLIEGVFADSLTEEEKRHNNFRKVNVAFIDCDLYASTRDVLRWLASLLTDGSILLFDDWRTFGENPELGQQRAFREFQDVGMHFDAEPFVDFEDHGKGFILRAQ